MDRLKREEFDSGKEGISRWAWDHYDLWEDVRVTAQSFRGSEPMSVEELRQTLTGDTLRTPEALERYVGFLESGGVLVETADGRYAMNRKADQALEAMDYWE